MIITGIILLTLAGIILILAGRFIGRDRSIF